MKTKMCIDQSRWRGKKKNRGNIDGKWLKKYLENVNATMNL